MKIIVEHSVTRDMLKVIRSNKRIEITITWPRTAQFCSVLVQSLKFRIHAEGDGTQNWMKRILKFLPLKIVAPCTSVFRPKFNRGYILETLAILTSNLQNQYILLISVARNFRNRGLAQKFGPCGGSYF